LVCIKIYRDSFHAEIEKDLLIANGIEAVIFSDSYTGADPHFASPYGAIRLMIREEDVSEAKKILDELK